VIRPVTDKPSQRQVSAPLTELRAALSAAAGAVAGEQVQIPAGVRVERSKRAGHGDYSSNIGMLLAPIARSSPRELAERIGSALAEILGPELTGFDVAGPGFLNISLADRWFRGSLEAIIAAGDRYGGGGAGSGAERVLVEFVSANPTGPLVAASGRHAAYGDALARILAHHGHTVSREYYFNDAGTQIRLLGESVLARARGEEVPEGGYQGDYVRELASRIDGVEAIGAELVAAAAVAMLLERIEATLERYGVHFDQFFSERTLHEGSPSYLERALAIVAGAGRSYEAEGAMWLRTTDFGDDKDRVLVRSDGTPTYFAADLAYMLQKRERGLDRQLLPVGSDHHGYVARMKAALASVGGDPDTVEMPIIQFVHLVEGEDRTAMSKRRGEFVTLDELLDEIGVDATRFFMLQRSHDRTLDLDLELARRESSENPVYYVQYAHARIVTMLGRLDGARVDAALVGGVGGWGDPPLDPAERELIGALAAFPDEVAEAAERRAPHRIAAYALELAQQFTAFYRDCKVIGAEPPEVESFRVALSQAARQAISLSLGLLGVSAPDSM
jgi:arginyl-tRNA synthetase